jgi:hypothetical protein
MTTGDVEAGTAAAGRARVTRYAGHVLFAAALLAVAGYLVAIPLGLVAPDSRFGTAEAVLVTGLLAALAVGIEGYRLEGLSITPAGINAKLHRIRSEQQDLASDVHALQLAITGLVTKFERQHLELLSGPGPATVRITELLMRDLERLDAIDFVEPADPRRGLNAIRQDFGGREADFDLKPYVTITDRGLDYLELRRRLGA